MRLIVGPILDAEKGNDGFRAQYAKDTIVIYQAFNKNIADFALNNQRFGGNFSLDRTSWIKTSFLWMMYRSGWGQRKDQEKILAVHLDRKFFNKAVEQAVHTSYQNDLYSSEDEWRKEMKASDVLVQFDPDRNYNLQRIERKAIQICLKKSMLEEYTSNAIHHIEDISDYVAEQKDMLQQRRYELVQLPVEKQYTRLDSLPQ